MIVFRYRTIVTHTLQFRWLLVWTQIIPRKQFWLLIIILASGKDISLSSIELCTKNEQKTKADFSEDNLELYRDRAWYCSGILSL